jgi:prepilin-type N-terminal cleavage/methylation domain-containing protein/prepilin-type processing-associated H-X9-DG protein
LRIRGFTLIELLVVIAIIAILAAILFPVFFAVKQRGKAASCLSNCRQIGMALMNYAGDWDNRIPQSAWNWGISDNTPNLPCPQAGYEMLIMPYVKNWSVFLCPGQATVRVFVGGVWKDVPFKPLSDPSQKGMVSYGYSSGVAYPDGAQRKWLSSPDAELRSYRSLSDFPAATSTILLAENWQGWHDVWDGALKGTTDTLVNNVDKERHLGAANYVFADGHAKAYRYSATHYPHNLWTIDPND